VSLLGGCVRVCCVCVCVVPSLRVPFASSPFIQRGIPSFRLFAFQFFRGNFLLVELRGPEEFKCRLL
jgi:hypothetical protein